MKRILILVLALILISSVSIADVYWRGAGVYKLDAKKDVVKLKDADGRKFTLKGVQDWELGDVIMILMWDNDTADVSDDKAVDYRWTGFNINYGF